MAPERRLITLLLAATFPILFAAPNANAVAAAESEFHVPVLSLDSALPLLAHQADLEIFVPHQPLARWRSSAVRGMMSAEEALAGILRCTPFEANITSDRVIHLHRRDGRQLPFSSPSDDASMANCALSDDPPRVAIAPMHMPEAAPASFVPQQYARHLA